MQPRLGAFRWYPCDRGMSGPENPASGPKRFAPAIAEFVRSPAFSYAVVFCLSLAAVVALQLRTNAYHAEFGNDEASDYVSGLLLHDYLLSGLAPPVAFLRNFASHYPLVGIGHWGPLYYCVEAAWMLLFGCGRTAALLLAASITACIATICYAVAISRFGRAIAWLMAAAWIASPVAQESSSELMLDAPVALAVLLATLAYARFLASPTARRAVLFALVAVFAILLKGNSLCLALVPPLAVLMGRRFSLIRTPAFWLPLPIVACGVGPWYAFTWHLIEPGFRYAWGLRYTEIAAPFNAVTLVWAVGPLLLAMGLAGFVACLARAHRPGRDEVMRCAAALVAAVVAFQCIVPAAVQDRYMLPAVPPLLLLAGFSLDRAARWLRAHLLATQLRRWALAPQVLLAIACLVALAPTALPAQQKQQFGLIAAARQVWAALPVMNRSVLVVANGGIEPAAIAELAMNDPHRPSMFAIRGSRLLGAGGYNNSDYVPRFQTVGQVMHAIDEYRIPLVLFASNGKPTEWQHVRQVAAAAASYPDRWQVLWRTQADGRQVILYRIAGNAAHAAPVQRLLELSAPHALGGHGP